MYSDLKRALFLVWIAVSAVGGVAVAAPLVFPEDVVDRIAPKCESKARGGPPCMLCGATTGFLRIAGGDLGGATEANRASVPLFFGFAANAAGAGLVFIRRVRNCR